jgi:phage terminase large subunit-like protein
MAKKLATRTAVAKKKKQFRYEPKKLQTRVVFASRMPTRAQMKAAHDEGWYPWIRSVQDEIAVAEGCWFAVDQAEAVRDFFAHRLTHGKAPFFQKPFTLDDYQYEDIIGPIYGWRTCENLRRYRSAYVHIPKKNGKTQLAAAIGVIELHYCQGSRVYIVATSEGQAYECFDESAGMVERNRHLSAYLKVLRSTGRIIWHANNSALATMAKAAASSEGKNASCLILDELHAWRDRKLFDSLLFAGAARPNPLLFMITTAGDDTSSLCYSEYERAKRIKDGSDPTTDHLVQIYEADKDAKYDDLKQWKKANPGFGKTINERGILSDIRAAKGRPARIATLKRYRLNIWTNEGEAWLDSQLWNALPSVTEDECAGVLYGGIDLARTRDFASLAMLFVHPGGFDLLIRIYCPESVIAEKEDNDKIPLSSWIQSGHVIATDGEEIDQSRILADALAANNRWKFAEIGFDPYNASTLAKDLRLNNIIATPVPQTMPFMGYPSAEFERELTNRNIRHQGNPCLSWMIGNAKAIYDSNNNVRPSKKKSNARIDGLVATIIAWQRAVSPDAQSPVSDTPYEWA